MFYVVYTQAIIANKKDDFHYEHNTTFTFCYNSSTWMF